MFADWDAIYRQIRARNLEASFIGEVPADSSELHRKNVVPQLNQDHQSRRTPILPVQA